jgi:hypothetical protein
MLTDSTYDSGSVFTVTIDPNGGRGERRHHLQNGTSDTHPSEPSFDLAVIQFSDDGAYVDSKQIAAATDCIRKARASQLNPNGALVVVFIHGWHHGASWKRTPSTAVSNPDSDKHFHFFRLALESLALREVERQHIDGGYSGRRVVGIYIAWNGDPGSLGSKIPLWTETFFWNRYKVAEDIGGSIQLQETIRSIIDNTKVAVPADRPGDCRPESPLVMIGHSMGALMLQSAFATLLEDPQQPLLHQCSSQPPGPVKTQSADILMSFPDLILSLNSAADSAIAKRILKALEQCDMKKSAAAGDINYSPPLLVSVTSTGDTATNTWWPRAKPKRKTDGNDSALFTHTIITGSHDVHCLPRGSLDLGQNWHCLRPPQQNVATPAIPIDLPSRERKDMNDVAVPHIRYTITPIQGNESRPHLMWVFQIPTELIKDHNDISNSRARSLTLALIQISGAVASLAKEWVDSFEPIRNE